MSATIALRAEGSDGSSFANDSSSIMRHIARSEWLWIALAPPQPNLVGVDLLRQNLDVHDLDGTDLPHLNV